MCGVQLRTLRNIRVVKPNNMASGKNNTISATVALALHELSLSHGDLESLSVFLTDYIASDDYECGVIDIISQLNKK